MTTHGTALRLAGLALLLAGAGAGRAEGLQDLARELAVRASVQGARVGLTVAVKAMDIENIRGLARSGLAEATDDAIQADYDRWYRDTKTRFPALHAKYARRYDLGPRITREKLLAIVGQATREQCLELVNDLPDELIEENLKEGLPAVIGFLTQPAGGGSPAPQANRP